MSDSGDITIEKVDDTHQNVIVKIETGNVIIRVKDGANIWAENGEPSIIHGEMKLWTNEKGVIHRIDGPAVIDPSKNLEKYFIEGTGMPKEEFYKDARVMNIRKKEIDLDYDPENKNEG